MSIRRCLLALAALAMLAGSAVASESAKAPAGAPAAAAPAAELWTDNFEQAKAQAKKEGKDLLLDFTGSDWCIWCVRLRKEVFDTEKFKAEAPKKFVLVELDFPHQKALSAALKKQNDALQEQFAIDGFPTILLMDSDGRAYAKAGYQPGGPEKYLDLLDGLQKKKADRDKLLAEADKAQGIDRAKALDKLVEWLAKSGINPMANMGLVEEIIKLDSKNEAGLKAKYEKMTRMAEVQKLAEAGKFVEAAKAIDKVIADLKLAGDDLQAALFIKSFCVFQQGDKAGAITLLKAALDAAPDGKRADQIKNAIKGLSQPEPAPEKK